MRMGGIYCILAPYKQELMSFSRQSVQVILAGVICIAASCSSKKAARNNVTLETVAVSAKNNAATYRATSTKTWEIVHTKAALSFHLKEKTAEGREWVSLHPYFYNADTLVLDAKSMKIDTVMLANTGKLLSYNYKDDVLTISLDKTYSKEDTLQLYIRYKAMPYAEITSGSSAISDDKGLYFINTDNAIPGKPSQIWTQGETEANSRWLPTIDKPNQRTTVELALTVPDSFTTLSNGAMTGQQQASSGLRTDIWKMDKPIQVYAIMFAIGRFDVVKDSWKGKEVSYYVEPAYAPYAKYMFNHTPEMIDFFSTVTGVPYPWNKYSQVVVRDYVSGAMENTSASLFGSFMNQNKREYDDDNHEDVVSHELFHQWFGDYVTAESWSNLTVNESFATYGEQLWRYNKYGKASADDMLYRELNSYLGISDHSPSLVRFHYRDKEDMFDRISYQKGSVILHYLHGLMGDEAFYQSMKKYLTDNALQSTEATNWRLALEAVTGQDWNWFFDQWYYRGGHPKLDVQYTYDDAAQKLTVVIAQIQPGTSYKLPLKSAVVYGNEKQAVDWAIAGKNTSYTYPYKNGVKPLVIPDIEHWLPGEMTENKTPADWLLTYKNSGDDIITKFRALIAGGNNLDDRSNQAIVDLALQDKDEEVTVRALQLLQKQSVRKRQDKWQRDVIYLSGNGSRKVKAAAISVLAAWKTITKPTPEIELDKWVNDSSYMVAGAALRLANSINKDTAYAYAKQLLPTHPRGDLMDAVMLVIAQKGQEGDIALFEATLPEYDDKINMVVALTEYMQAVRSEAAFDKALALSLKLVKQESIQKYRSSAGSYVISVADYYKDRRNNVNTNSERDEAVQRLEKLKAAIETMINEDPSEENKTTYRNYMKTIFR